MERKKNRSAANAPLVTEEIGAAPASEAEEPVSEPDAADQPPVVEEAEAAPAPETEELVPEVAVARPRRRLRTGAMAGGLAVLAVGLFAAGFAVRALTEKGEDLGPIQESLRSLDQRTDSIEQDLTSLVEAVAAGGSGSPSLEMTADGDDPSWGPEDAAVVIEQFADFQCPYCARFALETLPQIKEAYGEQVRLVYRDFPISGHQYAQKAAEAAQCASDQERFWEYHDLLFANQSALDVPQLKQYAADAALDTAQFNDCLDSGKNSREVLLDFQEGRRVGVNGTPSFIIGGAMISGAYPFEQFRSIIDQALTAAQ